MHMSDALISPAVGGTMWMATAATFVYCSRKIKNQADNSLVPLMGVMGAFVFAVQMINFSIPATGSSGHLGGGLLLAVLLGPYAGFLTMASVLTVQALFFADGGLLALGATIFNLGFFPSFIAYPFIYKKLVNRNHTSKHISTVSIVAAIIALQMGSFGVVLQTTLSGISSLPFSTFTAMVLPIHLAIGLVEGIVTAGLIAFILKARPEILIRNMSDEPLGKLNIKKLLATLVGVTVITAGIFSWYASEKPDGLEWAIAKVSGSEEIELPEQEVYNKLSIFQEKSAIMPDYGFKKGTEVRDPVSTESSWGTPSPETSTAGLVGGLLSLFMAGFLGLIFKKR